MDDKQKEMIEECIDSHYNMIRYHRRAIQDLTRKKLIDERCMECFDIEIKSGRSNKV